MTSSSEHFTQSAEHFDRSPTSRQLGALSNTLWPLLKLNQQQHWLDFGAGTGLLSIPLAEQVGQVSALDTSAAMLEQLQAKQIANIQVLHQDIFAALPQKFDGIISSMALHHVSDTPALLKRMQQIMHSGAQLALVDLYSEDGSFHGDNEGKGVKHLGFDIDLLMQQATQAGFHQLRQQPLGSIRKANGRDYPLFLLLGTA